MMKTLGRIVAVSAALVLTLSDPVGGQKPVSDASLMQHAVRVRSTGGSRSKASTGFVYLQHGQVVTTLHTVAGGVKFEVICKGESRSATLEKFHVPSDLALLRVTGGPFSNCLPVQAANVFAKRPPEQSKLRLAGTPEDNAIGTRTMDLQSMDPPETLERLLNPENLKGVKADGLPSVTLPIYYVQGGLLPGLSGAPVFDKFGRLVAIADGGLSRGAAGYNWLIPASNLKELMDQPTGAVVPSGLATNGERSFSADLVNNSVPSGTGTSGGRPAAGLIFATGAKAGAPPMAYWTKRQSAAELARTSDDPDAFRGLLQALSKAGHDAKFDWAQEFDIYQESDDGTYFAAPANWQVQYIPRQSEYLVTNPQASASLRGRSLRLDRFSIQRRSQTSPILQKVVNSFQAGDGSLALPTQPRYLQERIDEAVATLAGPQQAEGSGVPSIVSGSIRRLELANGKKVLQFAASSKAGHLKYEVWAVHGDDVTSAKFENLLGKGDSSLLPVVFALNLITLHDDGGTRRPATVRNDYVPGPTDPSTKWAIYDDEALSRGPMAQSGRPAWRFFHKRGKLWQIPSDDFQRLGWGAVEPWELTFVEIRREKDWVQLKDYPSFGAGVAGVQYRVPINGGEYYKSVKDGPFQPAGVVRRRPQ